MVDADSTEAFRKIFSVSCRPPPLPSRDAAAAPAAWVLLEPLAYIADQRNATTAEAFSSTGLTVQVTVCFTDPLGVSYVCVHCPGLKDSNYASRPSVVCSEKDFLLLSTIFLPGPQGREYFVYKAGSGRPSVQLIPGPYPRVLTASDFGLLPLDDGDHFVLATLCFTLSPWVYDLHLFSSRTWEWSTKEPQTEISSAVRRQVSSPIVPSKVIQLGGGTLGWVDLWRGIIVCNVLDEMPVLRFIALPMLMPGNKEGVKPCAWPLRNVAYSNGLIKFIEIEKHERPDADERSYDDMDTLYESDCLTKPKEVGWRAMTWYRMTSWDHWRKGCMAYDKEILVDCRRHSTLLPELTDPKEHGLCKCCIANNKEISVDYPSHSKLLPDLRDNNARELTLKDLLASHPVLSLTCHCDDVVYMLCKPKSCNPTSWLITVDLKKKILVDLAPFSLEGYFSSAHPSELSSYLNTAAATEGTSGP